MKPGSLLGILARVCATPIGAIGALLVAMLVVTAIGAPLIATHDPDALDVLNRFAGPSAQHWLGTDHLGRDLYSRLVHGTTIALSVACAAIFLAFVSGMVLGVAAGFLASGAERFILFLFDVVSAFPSLVLALAVVAVFGSSTLIVVMIAALTLTPHFGRVAYAQVLTLKSAPFLDAERLLGASGGRIIVSHIIPNIIGPLLVLAAMDIPVVITIEAGLSFLGLGVRPPLASWGSLIQDGYQYISDTWLPVTVASVALALATLGFTLFGEALRDAVDPRLSRAP